MFLIKTGLTSALSLLPWCFETYLLLLPKQVKTSKKVPKILHTLE